VILLYSAIARLRSRNVSTHYRLLPVKSNGARQAAACPALVASLTSTRRPFFTS
jgi:hypothetical protein